MLRTFSTPRNFTGVHLWPSSWMGQPVTRSSTANHLDPPQPWPTATRACDSCHGPSQPLPGPMLHFFHSWIPSTHRLAGALFVFVCLLACFSYLDVCLFKNLFDLPWLLFRNSEAYSKIVTKDTIIVFSVSVARTTYYASCECTLVSPDCFHLDVFLVQSLYVCLPLLDSYPS